MNDFQAQSLSFGPITLLVSFFYLIGSLIMMIFISLVTLLIIKIISFFLLLMLKFYGVYKNEMPFLLLSKLHILIDDQ